MILTPILATFLSLMISEPVGPNMKKLVDLSKKESWMFLAYDSNGNKTYYINDGKVELVYPKTDVIKDLRLNTLVELDYPAGATLSPDAASVAYVRRFSERDQDEAITIYDLRSNTTKDLIHSPKTVTALAWSPAGKEIAFTTKDTYDNNFRFSLYTVNLNTGEVTDLTSGTPFNPSSISWSPDGKEIVFQAGLFPQQPGTPPLAYMS